MHLYVTDSKRGDTAVCGRGAWRPQAAELVDIGRPADPASLKLPRGDLSAHPPASAAQAYRSIRDDGL